MFRPWHLLGHPDAVGGAGGSTVGPANPFSSGGEMSEGAVADRVPSKERKVHADKPAAKEPPQPKRPELNKPAPAETDDDEPAQAHEAAAPAPDRADAKPTNGEADEPEATTDEMPESVRKLLGKFKNVEGIANGYLDLQGLQFKTAEGKKAIEAKIERLNEFFDGEDEEGNPILRSDVASARLRAQRGTEPTDYDRLGKDIPIDLVRRNVEEHWKAEYRKAGYDDDGIADLLKANKSQLEYATKSEHARVQSALREQVQKVRLEAGSIIQRHLAKFPEHKKLLPRFGKLMDTMPEARQYELVREGHFGGVGQLFRLLQMESEYADDIKAAVEAGRKQGASAGQETTGGSPGASGRAPGKPRGANEQDQEAQWKKNLVNPTRKSTLERLGLP